MRGILYGVLLSVALWVGIFFLIRWALGLDHVEPAQDASYGAFVAGGYTHRTPHHSDDTRHPDALTMDAEGEALEGHR